MHLLTLDNKILHQTQTISDNTEKIEMLNKEKQNQKDNSLQKEKLAIANYDNLNNKYKQLIKKSSEFSIIETERETEDKDNKYKILTEIKARQDEEM